MDVNLRKRILAGAGYGFGVAGVIAPAGVMKAFGYPEVSGELETVMRAYSLRNIALAAVLSLTADEKQVKRFNAVAAGLFSADTVSTLWAAARGKSSWRAAAGLLPITIGLAALAAGGADVSG